MNVRFLIDRLVQHQAQLIAEVATSGGVRAPLAELADQLFIHLAEEFDRRGISRKVAADMFGMALRAYQKKTQRLAKSSTDNGTSLWQAVVEHLAKNGEATRAETLQRFCRDDEAQLRAVLFDLTESGLATCTGSGPAATYRLEPLEAARLSSNEQFADMVWLTIFREGPLTLQQLVERSHRRGSQVEDALRSLLAAGRVSTLEDDGEARYVSGHFEVPAGGNAGWEAAILDHVQALTQTIQGVLAGLTKGQPSSEDGGYTYTLDVWSGHPLEEEVSGVLSELRTRLSDLRQRVDAFNEQLDIPREVWEVTIYGGQSKRARRHRTTLPPGGRGEGS